jgi:hypothetical protein
MADANYSIKDIITLRKLLWLDFIMGSSTALIGLVFYKFLTSFFGLTSSLILIISVITFLYSVAAFTLARQKEIYLFLLIVLIYANWFWMIISIVLLFAHFEHATVFGKVFLILQIIVVGGLAWLEGNQLIKKSFS